MAPSSGILRDAPKVANVEDSCRIGSIGVAETGGGLSKEPRLPSSLVQSLGASILALLGRDRNPTAA